MSRPLTWWDTFTGREASRSCGLGNGPEAEAARTFSTAGATTVELLAPGAGKARTGNNAIIATSPAPGAIFSPSPLSDRVPFARKSTNASKGAITSRSSTVGNGAIRMQSPTYPDECTGVYGAPLKASSPGGTNTAARTNCVPLVPASSGRGGPGASTGYSAAGLVVAYGIMRPAVPGVGCLWQGQQQFSFWQLPGRLAG